MNYKIKSIISILVLTVALCSTSGVVYAEDVDDADVGLVKDPIESVNRFIYGFNSILDKVLLKPVAKSYRFLVPELARKGVRNVLTNLTEPVTFINSTLQGDVKHSVTTLGRFAVNSTFGVAGLFDLAKNTGLENRKEDFGQTIGVYGVGSGAYLILPVIGPSNVRDAFGRVVDMFIDPFNYILQDEALVVRTVVSGVDARESVLNLLDNIEKTSLDPYATVRSLYTQKRVDEIKNGNRKIE